MSQINKTCTKCNKLFKSEYLLNKHLNRAIPCGVVLNCKNCKKIFTTNQQLLSHVNRKISCITHVVQVSDKIALVNAKEKSELNIFNTKAVAKQKIIDQQSLQLENKQKLTREVIAHSQSKMEAALKAEEVKYSNKCNTIQIINDRAKVERQRLELNKKAEAELEYDILYKIAFKASKFTENFFTDQGIAQMFHNIFAHMTEESCINTFTKAETCTEIVKHMLKDLLNDANPKNKNLFYNSRIGMFCAIMTEKVGDAQHIVILQKTYAQVFDALLPIIQYCYDRFNGSEIALYGYKNSSLMAKNEVSHKFKRFDDERKTFTQLVAHNKQYLEAEMQVVLHNQVPVAPLQTSAKVLSHDLQTAITDNTNIYSASPISLFKLLPSFGVAGVSHI